MFFFHNQENRSNFDHWAILVIFIIYFQIRDVLKCEQVVRHFANTEKTFKLLLRKWHVLDEIKRILHIPYLTTNLLQKNEFTLTDFFGCIQIIDLKMKQFIENPSNRYTKLAEHVQQCMSERKSQMVDNPLMLCAIYLDPRYKCELDLNPEKLQFVKITLENIWERMALVKSGVQPDMNEAPSEALNNSKDEDDMHLYYSELDKHYCEMGLNSATVDQDLTNIDRSNFTQDKNKIAVAISKYERYVSGIRVKSSESIASFWETNKQNFGYELYEIASVIFAVPPTQASVERDFSALKFIFTDFRWNLAEDLLESLLIIHLNPDFYKLIKESEIEKLMKN